MKSEIRNTKTSWFRISAFVIVGIILFAVLMYVRVVIFGLFALGGGFDKKYSKSDLINNLELHEKEILNARGYFGSIIPENHDVEIEFEDENELAIFHVTIFYPDKKIAMHHTKWSLDFDDQDTREQLDRLKWSEAELDTLYDKLTAAGCISISSSRYAEFEGHPYTIGFQRSGMGKYSYKVFDSGVTDSVLNSYNSDCYYIRHNNRVILEYGGGAVGRQCFSEEERQ